MRSMREQCDLETNAPATSPRVAAIETTRFHFIGKQYMEKNLKGSNRLVCQP